jgi:4-hydroxythreonine-4-phosphate dehydrogenase
MTSHASPSPARPLIALAMGDPAGISAELTAKLLVDPEVRAAAELVVVGDRRMLADGERIAGVAVDCALWQPGANRLDAGERPLFVDLGHLDPATVERGHSTKEGGRFAMANFRTVLRLGREGVVGAATFTPFNKHAMKLHEPRYVDEIEIISAESGSPGPGREFNILEGLWNARVTSHVPISGVARLITKAAVLDGVRLTDRCMREAGFPQPRIAVAGLNPHAGDGGNFGREEIDEIEPAVAAAKAEGILCEGPFPSDTVFLRAKRGDFDAVQTMYHDQGQIAMKLIGFDKGVTLIGGYPFPVCTPAHGTAYDIAGKGVANLGASRNALLIAARMATPTTLDPSARASRLEAVVAGIRAELAGA